jgi:hypothetical protein
MSDMFRGERGPTGDHGQAGADGRQGKDGQQGERGPEGTLPDAFYEDPSINHAIAQAMGHARLRNNDKRLLILYAFLVVALAAMFFGLSHALNMQKHSERVFERQIIGNCEVVRVANIKFNRTLDQLAVNAKNTRGLTPEQKVRAQSAYASLRLPVTSCPVKR